MTKGDTAKIHYMECYLSAQGNTAGTPIRQCLQQSPAEVPPESVRASLQDGGSCCMLTACHTASHVGSPQQHSWSEPAIGRHVFVEGFWSALSKAVQVSHSMCCLQSLRSVTHDQLFVCTTLGKPYL